MSDPSSINGICSKIKVSQEWRPEVHQGKLRFLGYVKERRLKKYKMECGVLIIYKWRPFSLCKNISNASYLFLRIRASMGVLQQNGPRIVHTIRCPLVLLFRTVIYPSSACTSLNRRAIAFATPPPEYPSSVARIWFSYGPSVRMSKGRNFGNILKTTLPSAAGL
jgi:hypothetical protein